VLVVVVVIVMVAVVVIVMVVVVAAVVLVLTVPATFGVVQGGSNMTGTDLYVNKPDCAAAVRP